MKSVIDAILSGVALALTAAFVFAACSTDAEVASENLSKAADQFEIQRRVVFMNGITDTYMLEIQGRCSIEDEGHQLEVTCKDDDRFVKHFLGLSDNVSYFVEQLRGTDVSTQRYRVIFKPEAILPDIDVQ